MFQIPRTEIKKLANKYPNKHIIRGLAVRELMIKIAEIVVPAQAGVKNVLNGPVLIAQKEENVQNALYPLVLKHWRRGTTLQMLAIRIYMEKNDASRDAKLEERTLKRDLMKVREWEQADAAHIKIKKRFSSREDPILVFALPTSNLSEDLVISAPKPKGKRRTLR
jgi:hypothetical protein